jgi:hypothetical protein
MTRIVAAPGIPSRRGFLKSGAALAAAASIPPLVLGARASVNASSSVTTAGDTTMHDFVTTQEAGKGKLPGAVPLDDEDNRRRRLAAFSNSVRTAPSSRSASASKRTVVR